MVRAKPQAVIAWLLALFLAAPIRAQEERGAEALPSPLRLEHVVRFATEHRAEIMAAHARTRAAAQQPAIVSAPDDPMISASVDHLPFRLDGANASFAIEQRFPLSGVLGNRKRVAEAEARRQAAEVRRTTLDVELDAARAFLVLRVQREMVGILEEQRDLAQKLLRAATARYAAGSGAQADALRSEIEVARLDAALRAIAAEVRGAEVMLNTSLGRSATAAIPALDGSVVESGPGRTDVVSSALANRPELRAGEAEISRARAEVSVMESMYSPMAMVRTGPAYTMTDGPGWMLMVGVSIPLWRERLRAGTAQAQAMVDMAQADLRAMRRMVEGDVLTAREQVIGARERFLALRDEIIPRATQAIAPTMAGYSSGQLPLVSVIEAAQALWSAQGELLTAEFELDLAWARLYRATGNRAPGERGP